MQFILCFLEHTTLPAPHRIRHINKVEPLFFALGLANHRNKFHISNLIETIWVVQWNYMTFQDWYASKLSAFSYLPFTYFSHFLSQWNVKQEKHLIISIGYNGRVIFKGNGGEHVGIVDSSNNVLLVKQSFCHIECEIFSLHRVQSNSNQRLRNVDEKCVQLQSKSG